MPYRFNPYTRKVDYYKSGGVTDHGLLSGLADDDHTQYHNDTRALAWLATRSTSDLPEGSNLYFTDSRAVNAVATADDYLLNTGDIGTGVFDFGGATSFEIPNGATPTVDADGEIAFDTTVTDFSTGLLKFYGNEEQGIVSMPISQFTSPTNGYVIAYNSTNDEFELVAQSGGGGGITVGGTVTSGTDTRLFWQDGSVVAQDAELTWNKTRNSLKVNSVEISQPTAGSLYVGTYPASIVNPNLGTCLGFLSGSNVTSGTYITTFGYQAGAGFTTQIVGIAFGANTFVNAGGTRGIAVGFSTQANNAGTDTTAFGSLSCLYATSETGSILAGTNSGTGCTTGFWNILMGDLTGAATGASYGSVIIGGRAGQTAGGGFHYGRHVILGYAADAVNGIGLTIAIGAGAITASQSSCLIGGTIALIDNYYFGLAEQNATPLNVIMQAGGGTGTNVSGAKVTWASGRGTGNAPENPFVIATPTVGSSGTTRQTLADRIKVYSFYSSILNRLEEARGADVASANDTTLGNDGNFFVITGTTTINGIKTLNWGSGSRITLMFTGALTLKHNTAPSAGFAKMKLHGAVDLVTANGDMVDFRYDGTDWRQTSPVSNTGA